MQLEYFLNMYIGINLNQRYKSKKEEKKTVTAGRWWKNDSQIGCCFHEWFGILYSDNTQFIKKKVFKATH